MAQIRFVKPEWERLRTVGRRFKPFPASPEPKLPSGSIKWHWFPNVGVTKHFWLILASILSYIIGIGLVSAVRGAGGLVGGAFFLLLGIFLIYLLFNIKWNFRYREAICHALLKRDQAQTAWEAGEKDNAAFQKDLFHIETGPGYYIKVLRDASVEFLGKDYDTGSVEHLQARMDIPEGLSMASSAV